MAADKQDAYGMFNYALCLFDRKEVPSDPPEAARLSKSVADGQYAFGEVNFGFCLHECVSVDRDCLRSVKYFKSAANRGDCVGQFNYGLRCYKGEGISMKLTEAAEHFSYRQIKVIRQRNLLISIAFERTMAFPMIMARPFIVSISLPSQYYRMRSNSMN
jgi:TPR repeat protein